MNKAGSGITSVNSFQSDEMRLFRGGLRNVPDGTNRMEIGKANNFWDGHDFLNYERGSISHSRSLFNQHFNYHYMYGGARKFIGER